MEVIFFEQKDINQSTLYAQLDTCFVVNISQHAKGTVRGKLHGSVAMLGPWREMSLRSSLAWCQFSGGRVYPSDVEVWGLYQLRTGEQQSTKKES